MSSEFQIIFTAIITLLAGLALFILRGVYKKFEALEKNLEDLGRERVNMRERLAVLETINKIKKE